MIVDLQVAADLGPPIFGSHLYFDALEDLLLDNLDQVFILSNLFNDILQVFVNAVNLIYGQMRSLNISLLFLELVHIVFRLDIEVEG